ncbi:N4-gp56 family major capsid protein [bacterium]|nr:N4-gp56 family major capsid protein [bacterium]|tara:strand:+ start:1642 stop:2598 length:957 start_codon:yes stop_codon:yes gene_type:complete
MADILTNVNTVPNALQAEYWQRMFLSVLEANLLFSRFGIQGQLPAHSGRSVFWPRVENIAMVVTSQAGASEGKDPDAAAISVNVVSAQLAQYKQWYRLSDIWNSTNLPGTTEDLIRRMAYRGALSVDTVIRDSVMTAGGSAQIAGTAVVRTSMNRNGSFDLDVAEIRQAVMKLRGDNVPTFGDGLFAAIVHPNAEYDLQGDSDWTDIVNNTVAGINRAFQGFIGNTYGCNFFVSTQAKVVADGASAGASADVAQTYIFGEEYYGVANPRDVEIIIKDPAPASPLNSYASYGWKLWMAATQLASARHTRIESALGIDNS